MTEHYRIEMFKETRDEWCPNYKIPGDLRIDRKSFVRVAMMNLSDGQHRVCVWGMDDMGMERDFQSKGAAKDMYKRLAMMPSIEVSTLRTHGFVSA